MKKVILFVLVSLFFSCSSSKKISSKDHQQKSIKINNVKVIENKGDNYKNAIIIIADNTRDGISSEYKYIAKLHGKKWVDWKPLGQSLNYQNNIPYDVVEIEDIKNKTTKKYYFNIKSFFGKF